MMLHTPASARKLFTPVAVSILSLLVLAAAGSSGAPAATGLLPDRRWRQRRSSARWRRASPASSSRTTTAISRSTSKLSPQVLDRFLTALDPQHSYFLASDVAGFDRWRLKFGDMIHTGEIDPAYLMFDVFQQRNRERIAVRAQAAGYRAGLDARREFRRSTASKRRWPADEAQMDELWRQRVKNDAISLMLTGKSWPETADTLRKRYERVLKRVGPDLARRTCSRR